MTRFKSGYARMPAELYQTPSWVLDALVEHLPVAFKFVWEPACGQGQLVRAMERHLATVSASDLHDHGFPNVWLANFLDTTSLMACDGIVTNPPYGARGETAVAFIRHGLRLIARGGFLALLLPSTFDNAITRADLFEDCPQFKAKIVVRKRIMWFAGDASPKENHAWFIWEGIGVLGRGAPKLLYAPRKKESAHV